MQRFPDPAHRRLLDPGEIDTVNLRESARAAAGLDRRLSRAGDVPDDGRGRFISVGWPTNCQVRRIWELLAPSSVARGMGRLLAARLDPAVVFVSGRRGAAVLAGKPARQGPVEKLDDGTRTLAFAHPGFPGRLPAVASISRRPTSRSKTHSARSAWAIRSCLCSRSSPRESSGSRWWSFWSATGRRSRSIRFPAADFDFAVGRCSIRAGRTTRLGSLPTGIRTATWPGPSTPGF